MGFRFRQSVRIVKGVRLNIGKKGTSLSIGGKGMTLNVSKKGTKATIGIPGTGISYTENLTSQTPARQQGNHLSEPLSIRPRFSDWLFYGIFIGFIVLIAAQWIG